MTAKPPKSHLSPHRSAFALIDPIDAQLHRQFDRHGYLTSGHRTHIAVLSYVWSEWRDRADDRLPKLDLASGAAPIPTRRRLLAGYQGCHQGWGGHVAGSTVSASTRTRPRTRRHWIPRMDEIYYEGRCTILLLRSAGLDVSALLRIRDEVRCPFQGPLRFRDIAQMVPHECILCRSCAALPATLPEEIRMPALKALRELLPLDLATTRLDPTGNTSEPELPYLLGRHGALPLPLADTGVIAALLFRQNRQNPQERWLDEYPSPGARRLWFVRQNYEGGRVDEPCDANVLQMASVLTATVPSDRYYALCGILHLKRVKPNASHSADKALGCRCAGFD
ncbi:hypothetical protein PG996_004667 [Apiospora saccharicola]|uniref:Uncharacterized protein n=1 Tax=Apiospora saccharicola TaxID=335842 RepID=A0ABR1W4T3_9PEZI